MTVKIIDRRLAICGTCEHYRPNKPNTPIFINGYWWGGPDAGLCKRETEKYDSTQHTVRGESCEFHKFKLARSTSEVPEPW